MKTEFFLRLSEKYEIVIKQECIPVGCVPSAAVAVSGGGVVCLGGCLPGGVYPRGVSAKEGGRGGLPSGGVSAQRGCMPRDVCLGRGVSVGGIYSSLPLPVNRMTDRCKNITFPLLRLRTVMKTSVYF